MKTLRLISLLLPTVFLAAWASFSLYQLNIAPVVTLPIAGYDPVDVLHGHYVRFTVDPTLFEQKTMQGQSSGDECVCLRSIPPRPNGQNVSAEYVSCKNRAMLHCDHWASNASFFRGAQKYFIDERYASQLDGLLSRTMPRRARADKQEATEPSRVTMDIAISPGGAIKLRDLRIDGKPWQTSFGH